MIHTRHGWSHSSTSLSANSCTSRVSLSTLAAGTWLSSVQPPGRCSRRYMKASCRSQLLHVHVQPRKDTCCACLLRSSSITSARCSVSLNAVSEMSNAYGRNRLSSVFTNCTNTESQANETGTVNYQQLLLLLMHEYQERQYSCTSLTFMPSTSNLIACKHEQSKS